MIVHISISLKDLEYNDKDREGENMVKKTNELTFEVIKGGKTIYTDQKFKGVPDTSSDRDVFLRALRVWDNILGTDKLKWQNDFDFLYIKGIGHLISRHEIAQQAGGIEILKGVRYDSQGKLLSYNSKEERESYF